MTNKRPGTKQKRIEAIRRVYDQRIALDALQRIRQLGYESKLERAADTVIEVIGIAERAINELEK